MEDMTDMDETVETPGYTLWLKGEGITIERKLTKDAALAVISVALGGAPSMEGAGGAQPGAGSRPAARATVGSSGETPGEFIERVGARSNPDKIVAFGHYLHDSGQNDFAREDIKALFRAAHESPPGNFPRDFRTAVSSNRIAQEGASDRYFVTKTGRAAVESEFATRPSPSRRGRRRSRSAPASEDD